MKYFWIIFRIVSYLYATYRVYGETGLFTTIAIVAFFRWDWDHHISSRKTYQISHRPKRQKRKTNGWGMEEDKQGMKQYYHMLLIYIIGGLITFAIMYFIVLFLPFIVIKVFSGVILLSIIFGPLIIHYLLKWFYSIKYPSTG